jgi:hypothetical protein
MIKRRTITEPLSLTNGWPPGTVVATCDTLRELTEEFKAQVKKYPDRRTGAQPVGLGFTIYSLEDAQGDPNGDKEPYKSIVGFVQSNMKRIFGVDVSEEEAENMLDAEGEVLNMWYADLDARGKANEQ